MALTDDGSGPPGVPEPAPPGASLLRRLVPYASVAGAAFLLRIVIYAVKRRKE